MIVHILNGDSLKQRFPSGIEGEQLVFRECLIEGPVCVELPELLALRSAFLSSTYQVSSEEYKTKSIAEIYKIAALSDNSEVNLWFEEDLFCQVNLWFVVDLLLKNNHFSNMFLVTPLSKSPYSFDRLSEHELVATYNQKKSLNNDVLTKLSNLWKLYINDDRKELLALAGKLNSTLPFIERAVEAHIDRFPTDSYPGKPQKLIIEIKNDLKTDNYQLIHDEFTKRAPVYGFGDLQIKRLLESIGT